MKFLVPNYSCLQNPWLAGRGLPPPRSPFSVLCPQLNLLNSPPPTLNKIPGYATDQNYGRDEIKICRPGVVATWLVRMTVRLHRTAQYYVTDFVTHSELHIRVRYYVLVIVRSVCFRTMRYNFILRYTVNCTCFVQVLLMTQFYDIWQNTITMRVKWCSISYLVVVRIATRYRLDGSGFEPREGEGARDLFLHTWPARPSVSPSLLYNGHRGSSPQIKWPVRGVEHPFPYVHSTSVSAWHVTGSTLFFKQEALVRFKLRLSWYIRNTFYSYIRVGTAF